VVGLGLGWGVEARVRVMTRVIMVMLEPGCGHEVKYKVMAGYWLG
jgi:hypothetical protein